MTVKLMRVRRDLHCPICDRADWCLIAADKSACICARVESDRPAGRAGWWHTLRNDGWQRTTWRTAQRRDKQRLQVDCQCIAQRCYRAIRTWQVEQLAESLGVGVSSLEQLRVGWTVDGGAYAFPMRTQSGAVCGIRYRTANGGKFSERGGREGLFYQPNTISRDYLVIVEGASDAAAMMTLGYASVIGRANCVGNVEQILSLTRRLQPHCIVIVPDNDAVGVAGATALQSKLQSSSQLLALPEGVKDVRACLSETKNADRLAGQIGELIKPKQS